MHIQLSEIAGCAAAGTALPLDAVPSHLAIQLLWKAHEPLVSGPSGTSRNPAWR
mgnify:CR=1 FL=1